MKKTISSVAVVALMSLLVASCNKQAPKVDEKPAAVSNASDGMKIAYIEVDSIMSQYKFCKEYSLILEKKSQNIQNTINSKGRSLQNAVAKFQQDIQNNKYTQQQAEAVQAGLQKQDADLRELQQRLGSEFQTETEKFNKALRDSIQHYLAVYNKDKKYSLGVRCSAVETSEVDELTYLYLMRIRLQISSDKASVIKSSMAEETLLVKLADDSLEILAHDEMKKLLYARPEANLNQGYVHSVLSDGIEEYRRHPADIQRIVEARRQKLLDDTRATRAAASTTGRIEVRPCMPADLLGIYAFIPSAEDI